MSALLAPGTPIAVIAPSGRYDPAGLEAGLALARAAGHELVPFPGMLDPERYFASRDEVRLAHLTEALTSPDFGAVWAVRGGYGLTRILQSVPWERTSPRPVLGFSDVTPLLDAAWRRHGHEVVHGPVLHSLAATSPTARQHLFDLLSGGALTPLPGQSWREGAATAPMVGGNLALIAATCGTPLQLDATGCILALEDVGEAPYRIDRMLQQLASAGVFDGISGVALGRFARCAAPQGEDWTLDDVLRERLVPLGVPIVADLPFGHVADNFAWPVGRVARLGDDALDLQPHAQA